MLDPYMTYSCGYWKRANNLEMAQRDKLELICRKLELKPGQRVLDIGVGFGSFARYAAEHYGVSVVGLSVSQEQIELGQRLAAGLPIEFRYLDYRDIEEPFDRIVSVGMFEHVGRRYHKDFLAACERCLRSAGLLLLHTVGFVKYILPGVEFPTIANVVDNAGESLVLENFHTLEGMHYDRTLAAGTSSSRNTAKRSTRCGSCICRAAPAHSAQSGCESGSSSFRKADFLEGTPTRTIFHSTE
jgi:cyclopropane-fatty-acyl-phospholipid synthase